MVRVGGLQYTIAPTAAMGSRITDMRLDGRPLEAGKTYKVAGWAPVSEQARDAKTPPVWELVEQWLRARATGGVPARVAPRRLNQPRIVGADGNPGIART